MSSVNDLNSLRGRAGPQFSSHHLCDFSAVYRHGCRAGGCRGPGGGGGLLPHAAGIGPVVLHVPDVHCLPVP